MPQKNEQKQIDYFITFFPAFLIILLCIFFILMPEVSNSVLTGLHNFFINKCSMYYLIFGFAIFIISFIIAFSKFGNIKLGEKNEKPQYSFFQWGGMVFCAGLAADILFYSFSEWLLYVNDPYVQSFPNVYDKAITCSLFHWGFTPWSFYLVLASAFGFMMHIRNRNRQKYSESIRPLLGKQIDKTCGRIIDVLAVFALIAGCATTFALATPLMSQIITELFGIQSSKYVTIFLLLLTCACYIASLMNGLRGINFLSKICMYIFIALLLYILFASNNAINILGGSIKPLINLVKDFVPMSLNLGIEKEYSFSKDYTSFYWAYWMVWCVAAPFFIAQVSRGRTIKQTILGGYVFGLLSTFCSFIILSGFTIGIQKNGLIDLNTIYLETGNLYDCIIASIKTLPMKEIVFVVLFISMMCFYATSFDSISLVASYYSYKNIKQNDTPQVSIKLFWAIMLILFPIALTFSSSSMQNLQAVSIIAAFPIGIVIILIVISFFKDAKNYLKENESEL